MNAAGTPNEVIFLLIAIFSFSTALLVLFVLLSFLRRQRLLTQQPRLIPVAPRSAPARSARAEANYRATRLPPYSRRIAPESHPLPVRDGTSDQIVIMIEPDQGPTRQERNVQRIIKHLKDMDSSTKAEAG